MRGTAVTVGAGALTGCQTKGLSSPDIGKKRVIRFAHFTDIHLFTKHHAPEGLAAALQHCQSLPDKPQLLITGGDNIMDCFGADDNLTSVQYNRFREVFAKYCKIPVKFCIGNHDVWGWNEATGQTTGQEQFWGKKRPMHEFDMPNSYYSFDKGCWHFIILDSIYRNGNDYLAKLDDKQFQWLESELQNNQDKYIVIISHIPILSVTPYLMGNSETTGNWVVPGSWMHLDARKIKDLFKKYPTVKLCISGHMHLNDRVEYLGITYICDGAVSAKWWGGNNQETEEGYGIFDLYNDGSFEYQYIAYGWTPKKTRE